LSDLNFFGGLDHVSFDGNKNMTITKRSFALLWLCLAVACFSTTGCGSSGGTQQAEPGEIMTEAEKEEYEEQMDMPSEMGG
jgi:hypothetical protein